MPNQPTLEVCVESVDHAVAAERGGAHRLELCSDLSSGGITPSAGLMQTARRHANLPIHVLIRPRPGNFCYSDHELEIMRCDIQTAKQVGMDGIVLGVLHANNRVDIAQTKALVQLANPLPVTFHRAFDASHNLETSLEDVIQTGAPRILTSGGEASAMDALSTLARLVQLSRGRILVMPCGGIIADNVVRIARTTLAQEFHTSVGTSHPRSADQSNRLAHGNDAAASSFPAAAFEERVRNLVNLLRGLADSSLLKAPPAAAGPPQSKEPTA
ncbi:MAG TPA: copper homeostasis protein CutC [Candidatus Sulfotelmatobacter sp.]